MTNTEKRDQLWDQYQAMLANPKTYRIDKVLIENKIENLNEAIAAGAK
jgi:hypothetical protein